MICCNDWIFMFHSCVCQTGLWWAVRGGVLAAFYHLYKTSVTNPKHYCALLNPSHVSFSFDLSAFLSLPMCLYISLNSFLLLSSTSELFIFSFMSDSSPPLLFLFLSDWHWDLLLCFCRWCRLKQYMSFSSLTAANWLMMIGGRWNNREKYSTLWTIIHEAFLYE